MVSKVAKHTMDLGRAHHGSRTDGAGETRPRSRFRRAMGAALLAAPILLTSSLASAVQINVNLEQCLTNPNDPDGSKLMAHAEVAAAMWMDLLPKDDLSVYSIDICWDHSSGGLTLGEGWPPPWFGIWIERTPALPWFFDPTPGENSEFGMKQVLFRDLSSAERTDFFEDDPPPDLMEVGFEGKAPPDSPAKDKFDLLSVILHEIGHKVGVNYVWGEDYDIEPFLIGGFSNTDIKATLDHLTDTHALMTAILTKDIRKLPSAADLFAVVDDEDYTSIHLKRMDLLGNAWGITPDFWDMSMNWEGGSLPDSTTDVFLRKPATVLGKQQAGTMSLGFPPASPADTGLSLHLMPGASINVIGLSTVALTEQVIVEPMSLFRSHNLDLFSSALQVNGGHVLVGKALRVLQVDGSILGTITGHGAVGAGTLLQNSGEIAADDMGTGEALSFDTTTGTLDLGGTNPENAVVAAQKGDLAFANGDSVAFNGTMRIGSGRKISFLDSWTLGKGGTLSLDGANMPATFQLLPIPADRALTAQGVIAVEGHGVIDADLALEQPSELTFRHGAQLDFARFTTYDGVVCSSSGDGTLRQLGDAEVKSDSSLDVETFDWDGDGSTKTTIDRGATFSILAQHLGDDDVFHGAVENRSGTLVVTTYDLVSQTLQPWTIGPGGLMHLDTIKERAVVKGSDIGLLGGGHVIGEGDIATNLSNRDGIVEPAGTGGDRIGTLVVSDKFNYSQGGNGALWIDLATSVSPYRNDLLEVTNTAWLGGTLRVRFDGPEPLVGSSFDIVTSQLIVGTFTSYDLQPLTDKVWDVQYLTGVPGLGDVVRLRVLKP